MSCSFLARENVLKHKGGRRLPEGRGWGVIKAKGGQYMMYHRIVHLRTYIILLTYVTSINLIEDGK